MRLVYVEVPLARLRRQNREREHTLSEVAKELGVSLERVRQIQVRAIGKLKTPTLRKAIDPYL